MFVDNRTSIGVKIYPYQKTDRGYPIKVDFPRTRLANDRSGNS